jgi:hypothetical protein
MPIVTSTYVNPTGRKNVIESINKFLQTNCPPNGASDFTYQFTAQITPTVFPCVQVKEFPFFEKGSIAFGDVLFNSNTAGQTEGHESQLMLQIDILTEMTDPEAKRKMYTIRDRIVRCLTMAGRVNDIDNTEIVPPIKVLDYSNGQADTHVVCWVPRDDNVIMDRYFEPSPDVPNIHRYQMLIRFNWYEMN